MTLPMDSESEDPFETPTRYLFPTENSGLLARLVEFRKQYELLYGLTDTDVNYTSQLPYHEQRRMMKEQLEEYYLGLPPFVIAYYEELLRLCNSDGRLDDAPDHFIKLYVKNKGRLVDRRD